MSSHPTNLWNETDALKRPAVAGPRPLPSWESEVKGVFKNRSRRRKEADLA
jgi:hypothetical protein